ncbi:hypothetical protein MKW98_027066 [Papaver atlanticum]|uniref:Uncharacterized protein n=1 Tax=Papaver atlanticum TaxID=357466 RepID=A0AAD4RWU8_9MAGN|nr:hypothetical protein MKW98_027066 [Papaver atlanticum]
MLLKNGSRRNKISSLHWTSLCTDKSYHVPFLILGSTSHGFCPFVASSEVISRRSVMCFLNFSTNTTKAFHLGNGRIGEWKFFGCVYLSLSMNSMAQLLAL